MNVKRLMNLAWILILAPLTGCNVFQSVDKPSSEAQYRSAAEACIDQGDLNCAEEYLGKLSDSDSDTKLSLQAYVGMSKVGVSPGRFMKTIYDSIIKGSSSSLTQNQDSLNPKPFGRMGSTFRNFVLPPVPSFDPPSASTTCQLSTEKNYGVLITGIAKLINQPSTAQRQSLFETTVSRANQIQSPSLKAYLKFLTNLTFVGHLLAENQSSNNTLTMSDLVSDPSGCLEFLKGDAIKLDSCGYPTSKLKLGSAIDYSTATSTELSGDVTMNMISSGVAGIANAISDLEVSSFDVSKLKNSVSLLAENFGPNSPIFLACSGGAASDCAIFRSSLLNSSIGDCQ